MCNTFFNMILQRLFENIKNNSLIITFAEFFIGLIVISFLFFLIRIKIKNISIGNIEQWMSVHTQSIQNFSKKYENAVMNKQMNQSIFSYFSI